MERLEWRTLNKMNNPVFIGGLRPWQWMLAPVIFVVILFILFVGDSPFRFLLLLFPVLVWRGVRILAKENDKGHPDYFDSVVVWFQIKKHFVDTTNVFNKLREKSERAGAKI